MPDIKIVNERGVSTEELKAGLEQAISGRTLKKVLIIPPDLTRMHSYAGIITGLLYEMLKDSCRLHIMPALGTHDPMSREELRTFFGKAIPEDTFLVHDWRRDVIKIGCVPGDFVREVSHGLMSEPIDVEINRHLLDSSYDLIVSIGQVVPHEVVGMANYSKNILVGCGGCSIVNGSHMLGAVFGMERIMGRDHSPVRKVFDYAEKHFLSALPLLYVLTVTSGVETPRLQGLFIGRNRGVFEEAVALSQKKNLTLLDRPLHKVVVYLDEKEFKSTWLGNKAIYRTRMAVADGGALIILAPGVRKFGEDATNDLLIRKFGYCGRDAILSYCEKSDDLRENLSVAAHLIHGSSEGRFSITYAPGYLSRDEIEAVNFRYGDYCRLIKKYDPAKLANGPNIVDGEDVFFISNPALGLWALADTFYQSGICAQI